MFTLTIFEKYYCPKVGWYCDLPSRALGAKGLKSRSKLKQRMYYIKIFSLVCSVSIIKFYHVMNKYEQVTGNINNLHQNIKFAMEEGSTGELAFLSTLLRLSWDLFLDALLDTLSLYLYTGSPAILTNTFTTALTTKQVAQKVLFPSCLLEHIPLSLIKMT